MALNISPFRPIATPFQPQPVRPINNGNWGPPDMAAQIQQAIGSLGQIYQGAKKEATAAAQAEIAARNLEKYGPGAGGVTGGTVPGTMTTGGMTQSQYDQQATNKYDQYIKDTAAYTGLPEDYFRNLIRVESGGANVGSKLSSAKGVTQFTDATWKQYGQGGDVMDPQANIAASGRLALANRAVMRDALGRDPTPGELYLAHQQGAEGAIKLLTNPNARAADLVGLKAITNNAGNPNMTAGQYAGMWTGRFGSPAGPAPVAQTTPAVTGNTEQLNVFKNDLNTAFPGLTITSEYRSPEQNKAAGGASGSQHMKGTALDVSVRGKTDEEKQAILDYAISKGARGIGYYPKSDSFHFDFRPGAAAAWGPSYSSNSLPVTPPWFQQRAAALTSNNTPGVGAGPPGDRPGQVGTTTAQAAAGGGGTVAPVTPGAPQTVAAAAPGTVTRTPTTQAQVAGGQNQPPLFQTPQMAQATAGAAGAQAPNPQLQTAQLQPPAPNQPQPLPPGPQLAGGGGDTTLAGGTVQPRVADDPGLAAQGRMPTPDVLTTGSIAPTAPANTAVTPQPAPPAPVAAPAAATPAMRPQTASMPAGAASPMPREAVATLAQAGVPPQLAQMAGFDPHLRAAFAAAIRSRDPNVMQAVGTYAQLMMGAKGSGDWKLVHDSSGNWVRYNERTGEYAPVDIGGGRPGGTDDLILRAGDPRRKDYPGIPDDNRTYRVHLGARGREITPIDEREAKSFEHTQALAGRLEGNKIFQDYRQMHQAVEAMGGAFREGSPGGDFNGLLQVFKAVDPGSTVTQNEQTGAISIGGISGWGQYWANKIGAAGGFLTDELRTDFFNSARAQLESKTPQVSDMLTGIRNTAKANGLNEDEATTYYKLPDFEKGLPRVKVGTDFKTKAGWVPRATDEPVTPTAPKGQPGSRENPLPVPFKGNSVDLGAMKGGLFYDLGNGTVRQGSEFGAQP